MIINKSFVIFVTEKNIHQEPRVRHSSGTTLGRTQSPLNVTRGIVTKRGPFVEQVTELIVYRSHQLGQQLVLSLSVLL